MPSADVFLSPQFRTPPPLTAQFMAADIIQQGAFAGAAAALHSY